MDNVSNGRDFPHVQESNAIWSKPEFHRSPVGFSFRYDVRRCNRLIFTILWPVEYDDYLLYFVSIHPCTLLAIQLNKLGWILQVVQRLRNQRTWCPSPFSFFFSTRSHHSSFPPSSLAVPTPCYTISYCNILHCLVLYYIDDNTMLHPSEGGEEVGSALAQP